MKSLIILTLVAFSWAAFSQTITSDQPDKATLISAISKNQELSGKYSPELNALVARQVFMFYQNHFKDDLNTYAVIYPLVDKAHSEILASLQLSSQPLMGAERARAMVDSTLFEYHGHFPNNEFDRQVAVRSVSFLSDKTTMFSAGGDGRLLRWNVQTRAYTEIYQNNDVDRVVAISNDDKWLALATNRDEMNLFDLTRIPKIKPQPINSHRGAIYDLVFDNSGFYTIGADRKLNYTDLNSGKVENILDFDSKMQSVDVSSDGETLAVGSTRGHIFILDTKEDGSEIQSLERSSANKYPIKDLEFSPDGSILAIGGFNFNNGFGYVQLFDLETKEQIGLDLTGFTAPVNQVKFSSDGKYIAAASNDKTARVWRTDQVNKAPLVIDNARDWVWSIDFADDNQTLFTASADGKIRKHNLEISEKANELCTFTNRNLTQKEWDFFFGSDIPWQETCPGKL